MLPIQRCALAFSRLMKSIRIAPASGVTVWLLFIGYSATLALTEPAERSLVGDVAPRDQRGTAYGLYNLASGLFVLPGAVLFGVVWEHFGSPVAFGAAAAVTAIAAIGMAVAARGRPRA